MDAVSVRDLDPRVAVWTLGQDEPAHAQLAAAAKAIHNWEATGKIGEEPPDIPTIKRAVEKYLADAEARHLAPETVRKRRELLEGKLLPFCEMKGYAMLSHLDVDVLRTFRGTWSYSPLSARQRLEYPSFLATRRSKLPSGTTRPG
jgi:hypothetical protein